MTDKLNIANEMAVFDRKDRTFYDSLTDEERLNKHFFAVNKHPKLQWLMATTVSPGLGTFRHQWIAPKKKEAGGNGSIQKQLSEIFPNMKLDDAKLLSHITTKKELDQYLKDHGQDK